MESTETNLDFVLAQTCRMHFVASGRELEGVGLHRGQPRLLFALTVEDGRTHSQLAKLMEVTPATISNMVKRLEQGGFVVRRRDTADERVSRVYLTTAGQAIMASLKARMDKVNARAFADFSDAEKAQMRDFLQRVQANLQESTDRSAT